MIPGQRASTLKLADLNALADSLVRHIDETLQTHVELHDAPHARRIILARVRDELGARTDTIGVPR